MYAGMIRSVPVLMYHHVNPHRGDTVTITPEAFREQMLFLIEQGYEFITLDELCSFMAGEKSLTSPSVVLTFDDGWLDNYVHAFPVMREFALHGAFFLVAGRSAAVAGIPGTLQHDVPDHEESKRLIESGKAARVVIGWEIAREMKASGLAEFHSHSMSHVRCTGLSGDEVKHELCESKLLIENNIGCQVDYFCWPYGSIPGHAETAARTVGYKGLLTTMPGAAHRGGNLLSIPRVDPGDTMETLKRSLDLCGNDRLVSPMESRPVC